MATKTSPGELPNCPFRTAGELREACQRREASIDVQYLQATSWSMTHGGLVGMLVAIGIGAWLWVPILVLLFAAITRSWFSLLGIPVSLLFYNLGYPVSRSFVGSWRVGALFIVMVVLAVALLNDHIEVGGLAAAAILAWLANSLGNRLGVTVFQTAVLGDLSLLSELWIRNQLRVRASDGATYMLMGWTDSAGEFHSHQRS